MSDADVERLKGLVRGTLEANGVLGQVRAELLAEVCRAADGGQPKRTPAAAARLLQAPAGRLLAGLVREFLEFYSRGEA
ncbi:unnamed protein product [Prorocentrum cordatum]|uniref:Uncharacterized protein n=1 Tax=Prorocentrum cordatum TaxID=2364126 RepID=A0ABN9RUP9_9DINO|nr:unnamed protein product [Polarella glacialis]